MFTGIIEAIGEVKSLNREGTNIHLEVLSHLSPELKVDQSVAHNGVCLTVTKQNQSSYGVTLIEESLKKSNFSQLVSGSLLNLERSMPLNDRLDGHLVQGHVDQVATCVEKEDRDGSWHFAFQYDPQNGNLTVPKGSICINGVSLTVVESGADFFSVAIIPYTYTHTNFKELQVGHLVNLEFDIIGKYVQRILNPSQETWKSR